MLLLNFSHPLTDTQLARIENLIGTVIAETWDIPAQFDNQRPFAEQVRAMLDSLKINAQEWQTAPILVNPPAYNFAALTLLAELHGRMGYFPAIVRIRPVQGSTPQRYEVAEIINLQTVRQQARAGRLDEQKG
jgi:hypothetical protein